MNISEPFIRRPVATTLIMLACVVFGVMAYLRLPVSALPDVEFPTLVVTASLPGANPETMAASVATPLEREFSTIDGVSSMTSRNSLGSTDITLQFDLERDIDSAAQDVQSAISRATRRLPASMPTPPSFRKVNPADQPIVYLALSSSVLPLYEVHSLAETRLAQRISTIRGVAQVQIYGGQKYAVRIRIDPDRLASRGISLAEVSQAVERANVNTPTGTFYAEGRTFVIESNGSLLNAQAYRTIVIRANQGAMVRLSDVAEIVDSVESDKVAAWKGTPQTIERAIVLAVQKQPGANTVEVAQKVKALLPELSQQIPAAVQLELLADRSESIKESVLDVQLTLVFTLVLVVIVIFAFLRRVRATIIPSLSMPLALLGTFMLMLLLGYTLDNLSLMALTLSVGFVVDDAIVVLENIVRHKEQGKTPFRAAIDGSGEIGFTVVSMTISLVAVFIPFLFMGGIIGRLFEEFAVTISVAILISGLVSLSLTPMLAARMLSESSGTEAAESQRGGGWLDGMIGGYRRSLGWVLDHRLLALGFSLVILVGTVLMFQRIPKGFLPIEDTDQIMIMTEAIEGAPPELMRERQLEVARILSREPTLKNFMANIGRDGTNQGRAFVRLVPKKERSDSVMVVANRLRAKLSSVTGLRVFVQVPPTIRVGGSATKSEYQLVLTSTDTKALYEQAGRLRARLAESPILRDVATDAQQNQPELEIVVDRDRAALLGISQRDVEETLYSAYGSRQISTIYAATDTFAVILELDPATQRDTARLQQLQLKAREGEMVPLSAVARITEAVGPTAINHLGQLPAITLSFNVAPGHGLSEAVGVARGMSDEVLTSQVSAYFQGTAEAFLSSMKGLGVLLVISVLVIYLVLGILYESAIHPITILSALPFAGFGALLTLLLFGVELNVFAFVGVILLVGLVKKNGIMMVDFAIAQRQKSDCGAKEAILEACVVRFRPIMMTTMSALLGTLPIALGYGAGAEARQPLGLAVVGGLLFSQFFTMFVTPVFYVLFDGLAGVKGRAPEGLAA